MQTQSRIIDEVVRRFKNRMTATGHIAFLATLALPYVCCALISDSKSHVMPDRLAAAIKQFPGAVDIEAALKARPDIIQDFSLCLIARLALCSDNLGLTILSQVWDDVSQDVENDLTIIAIDRIILTRLADYGAVGSRSSNVFQLKHPGLSWSNRVSAYTQLDLLDTVVDYHQHHTLPFASVATSIETAIIMNALGRQYLNSAILTCFLELVAPRRSAQIATELSHNANTIEPKMLRKMSDFDLSGIYFLKGVDD